MLNFSREPYTLNFSCQSGPMPNKTASLENLTQLFKLSRATRTCDNHGPSVPDCEEVDYKAGRPGLYQPA